MSITTTTSSRHEREGEEMIIAFSANLSNALGKVKQQQQEREVMFVCVRHLRD